MRKRVFSISCVMLIVIAILFALININHEYEAWDSNISTQIKRMDGTIEHYDSNIFSLVNKGDIITINLDLPEEKKYEEGILYFNLYHSIVTVYCKGEEIYTYGSHIVEKGQMIGAKYHFIAIPEEAWGTGLVIEIQVHENSSFSKITPIRMYDAKEAYKAVLLNNIFGFLLSIVGIIVSAIVAIILLIFAQSNSMTKQGLYICGFIFAISIWMFSYVGGYVIFRESYMWTQLEYFSLYITATPLLFYVLSTESKEKYKKYIKIVIFINCMMLTCATLLNFFTPIHFNILLRVFHVLLVLDCIFMIAITSRRLKEKNITAKLFIIGMVLLVLFMIIDIIRHSVVRLIFSLYEVTAISIIPLGVLAFILCLIFSYYIECLNTYIDKSTKENLIKQAYSDFLTGISSSTKCREKLNEIDIKKQNEFIIVSLDLNDLKIVNDTMGHSRGDQLLKEFATIFSTYIGPIGLIGRIGGDEFIAIIEHVKMDVVLEKMMEFEKALEQENQREYKPYKISCAWGVAESTCEKPLTVKEALDYADKMMYQDKQQKKFNG